MDSGPEVHDLRQVLAARLGLLGADCLQDGSLSDAVFALVAEFGPESRAEWVAIAVDPESADLAAYAAVLGVTTVDRRDRNLTAFSAVMHDPELTRRLSGWPAFQMLLAEALMYESDLGRPDLLHKARAICASHLDEFKNHHGAQNLMVEICLRILADGKADPDVLHQAESANTRSLELSGYEYAKYFAHRAVLQAYRGHLSAGQADICHAIDLEPSDRWDYAARIAQYEAISARVETICLRSQLTREVEQARREIENSRGQVLTLTGLLAAVVAIVVLNVGVASRFDSREDALSLTLVGTGTVVVGFGLLISLVLPPRSKSGWALAVAVPLLGFLMLMVGIQIPVTA